MVTNRSARLLGPAFVISISGCCFSVMTTRLCRKRDGMGSMLTIVGLGGSLAARSRSRSALEVALAGASRAGAEIQLLDLRELRLPMFDPDDRRPTETAIELIDACHPADGLLWSSPLYQGTISGALKNALDWLRLLEDREPPFLHDKVVGVMAAG